MVEEQASIAVVFEGAKIPIKVEAKWYHYVAAFLWNLYRKPLVWKRQRELVNLSESIKKSMNESLLPVLWDRRRECPACYNAYLSLKPQIFLSQIEMILRRMACEDHAPIFHTFLVTWEKEFKHSERVARWINGL